MDHFKIAAKLYPTFFNHIIEFIFHNKYISSSYKKYLTNKLSLKAEIYNFWHNSTYLITQSQFKDFGNIKFSNNTMKSAKYSIPIFSIIIIFIDIQTFEKTIESIKKQNFDNYEIIVIYNLDEKLDVLPKNDNWKIISNKSKKGLIYLYSIGILASKGNYILTLQSGYILFQINSLYNIYQITKENNFDIYEFNLLINSFILDIYI